MIKGRDDFGFEFVDLIQVDSDGQMNQRFELMHDRFDESFQFSNQAVFFDGVTNNMSVFDKNSGSISHVALHQFDFNYYNLIAVGDKLLMNGGINAGFNGGEDIRYMLLFDPVTLQFEEVELQKDPLPSLLTDIDSLTVIDQSFQIDDEIYLLKDHQLIQLLDAQNSQE